MSLRIVLNNTRAFNVETLDEAKAVFDAYYANRVRSARTFTAAPLIADGAVVLGYFSMNGRFWTRENDPAQFDLLSERYFSKHL